MTSLHHSISQTTTSEELRTIFAQHGLRMTRQRESVYLTLIACESHPTADELMAMVHAVDPEVSQATIYNTLEALVGCGLAQRIPSPTSGGACRFDANTGDHVHMVLDDGRVLDVPMDLSKRILESMPADVITELSERTGIELSSIKIEFIGKKEVDQALMSD